MRGRAIGLRGLLFGVVILLQILATTATPVENLLELSNGTLVRRGDCQNPCGQYDQYCCGGGEQCYTSNNIALCATTPSGPQATGGYYQMYTSYYVITQETLCTIYTTYSSYVPAWTPSPTTDCDCEETQAPITCSYGETSCGNICCSSSQYCQVSGQCAPLGGGYSAPYRVTTETPCITQTGYPSVTVPFQSAVATNQAVNVTSTSSSSGLSGGAIAGIVIGVIAGIILLLLICLACCFRAAWDALIALCGGRRKTTRRETVEYKSYHRSGEGGSRKESRSWHGQPSRPPPKKKETGIGGWTGVAAGLGALAVVLGLKRRYDRKHDEKASSGYGSSDYYSDYYSASDRSYESDDRRTRNTRRTSRR